MADFKTLVEQSNAQQKKLKFIRRAAGFLNVVLIFAGIGMLFALFPHLDKSKAKLFLYAWFCISVLVSRLVYKVWVKTIKVDTAPVVLQKTSKNEIDDDKEYQFNIISKLIKKGCARYYIGFILSVIGIFFMLAATVGIYKYGNNDKKLLGYFFTLAIGLVFALTARSLVKTIKFRNLEKSLQIQTTNHGLKINRKQISFFSAAVSTDVRKSMLSKNIINYDVSWDRILKIAILAKVSGSRYQSSIPPYYVFITNKQSTMPAFNDGETGKSVPNIIKVDRRLFEDSEEHIIKTISKFANCPVELDDTLR